MNKDDILSSTGMSAQDIAYSAVFEFINGRIKWEQNTGEQGLFKVILTAMRRDFLDLVREDRAHKRTAVMDTYKNEDDSSGENRQEPPVLESIPDPSKDGFFCEEAAFTAKQIYPFIENDAELKEYADAILYCGCTKREDIATVLGISSQEVTNRQRRIRLALAPWYRRVQVNRKSTGH
jgi:DNA-directed RNA polymerase specialized sigma24 family protein